MDQERSVLGVWRSNQPQSPLPFDFREALLLVAGRKPLLVWKEPDLVQVDRFGLGRIEFAVPNARPGRHVLELAGAQHRAGAEAISVFQGTFQNVGDDLHVPVAVHPEALARLHPILVDDPQRTKTHLGRIVVGVERKHVPRIEPMILGMASLGSPPHMDRLWSHVQFIYG